MALDLIAIARILRGEVRGGEVLCPGPGHSSKDRSLAVRFLPDARGGFLLHSFAGDDPYTCRQHVRAALGIEGRRSGKTTELKRQWRATGDRQMEARIAAAKHLWYQSQDAHGTLVEKYLASRGLSFDVGLADAIRFYPFPSTGGNSAGAMVCLFRDVVTDEPCGVHRTFLDSQARKTDRRMLGRAHHAAVKLDGNADVTHSLTIGEGIETSLAGRQLDLGPVWALGSSGAVGAMPVLAGIDVLRVLAEHDENGANARALAKVAERWLEAEREVVMLQPAKGDMNDALKKEGCDG